MLMVIRGQDEDMMIKIIDLIKRSRDEKIRSLAEVLENHFNERYHDGGRSIQAGPQDKKNGQQRQPRFYRKTKNPKPVIE